MQREKKTARREVAKVQASSQSAPAVLPDTAAADLGENGGASDVEVVLASLEGSECDENGVGREEGRDLPATSASGEGPDGEVAEDAGEQDARAVAQAQDGLAGRWARLGEGVFDPEALDPEILDEEGDLGRFDVHDPHQLGELGEHLAARYLRGYGYTILERNYRCEFGEADLICAKDDCVVLVEVKTRLGGEAMPEEAVTAQKLKRYRKITLAYLMSHEWFDSVRLDVLAINIAKPRRAQVHHFMGVCEWEG